MSLFAQGAQLGGNLTEYVFVFVHIGVAQLERSLSTMSHGTCSEARLRSVVLMLRFYILVFVIFTERW